MTITEDSQLVDDVTCTVTGGACITFGASGVTLDLNGFAMTGLANPATACSGVTPPGGEFGRDQMIAVLMKVGAVLAPCMQVRDELELLAEPRVKGMNDLETSSQAVCISRS